MRGSRKTSWDGLANNNNKKISTIFAKRNQSHLKIIFVQNIFSKLSAQIEALGDPLFVEKSAEQLKLCLFPEWASPSIRFIQSAEKYADEKSNRSFTYRQNRKDFGVLFEC